MKLTTTAIVRRLVVVAGIAAATASIAPGMAGAAGCEGKVFYATKNSQTIHGTCGNDTFHMGRYANVTVHAGDGNDTVRAGFIGNAGTNYFYLGNGHDTVLNPNNKQVWVSAGAGNDTLYGSSGYDAFYGGTGTDTAKVTVGDFYDSIEVFV